MLDDWLSKVVKMVGLSLEMIRWLSKVVGRLSKVVRWLSKVVGWLSKVVRLLVVVRCRPPQAHGTATPKARTCEASCSASLQHIKS